MGNTSKVTVSELMADRSYEVKPTEQIVFRGGQINKFDTDIPLECGCPPPMPVLKTSIPTTPAVVPDSQLPAKVHIGGTDEPAGSEPAAAGSSATAPPSGPETASAAPSPNEPSQMDAPLVFSARNRNANAPLPVREAMDLPVEDSSVRRVHLDTTVQAPPKRVKAEKPGFFHRLKGIFSSIFS